MSSEVGSPEKGSDDGDGPHVPSIVMLPPVADRKPDTKEVAVKKGGHKRARSRAARRSRGHGSSLFTSPSAGTRTPRTARNASSGQSSSRAMRGSRGGSASISDPSAMSHMQLVAAFQARGARIQELENALKKMSECKEQSDERVATLEEELQHKDSYYQVRLGEMRDLHRREVERARKDEEGRLGARVEARIGRKLAEVRAVHQKEILDAKAALEGEFYSKTEHLRAQISDLEKLVDTHKTERRRFQMWESQAHRDAQRQRDHIRSLQDKIRDLADTMVTVRRYRTLVKYLAVKLYVTRYKIYKFLETVHHSQNMVVQMSLDWIARSRFEGDDIVEDGEDGVSRKSVSSKTEMHEWLEANMRLTKLLRHGAEQIELHPNLLLQRRQGKLQRLKQHGVVQEDAYGRLVANGRRGTPSQKTKSLEAKSDKPMDPLEAATAELEKQLSAHAAGLAGTASATHARNKTLSEAVWTRRKFPRRRRYFIDASVDQSEQFDQVRDFSNLLGNVLNGSQHREAKWQATCKEFMSRNGVLLLDAEEAKTARNQYRRGMRYNLSQLAELVRALEAYLDEARAGAGGGNIGALRHGRMARRKLIKNFIEDAPTPANVAAHDKIIAKSSALLASTVLESKRMITASSNEAVDEQGRRRRPEKGKPGAAAASASPPATADPHRSQTLGGLAFQFASSTQGGTSNSGLVNDAFMRNVLGSAMASKRSVHPLDTPMPGSAASLRASEPTPTPGANRTLHRGARSGQVSGNVPRYAQPTQRMRSASSSEDVLMSLSRRGSNISNSGRISLARGSTGNFGLMVPGAGSERSRVDEEQRKRFKQLHKRNAQLSSEVDQLKKTLRQARVMEAESQKHVADLRKQLVYWSTQAKAKTVPLRPPSGSAPGSSRKEESKDPQRTADSRNRQRYINELQERVVRRGKAGFFSSEYSVYGNPDIA